MHPALSFSKSRGLLALAPQAEGVLGRVAQCVRVHAPRFSCLDLGDAARASAEVERATGDRRLLDALAPAVVPGEDLLRGPCVAEL